jgi:amino acid transporter
MLNVTPLLAAAGDYNDSCGKAVCSNTVGIPNSTGNLSQAVANFTNLGLVLIGALAVVFIIVGGIQYITSSGDPAQVKNAKNTILYAIIGLVVAAAAYAIVSFLTGRLS